MTDKTIIVTGGARRIGAAICRHLHEGGYDVIIHYHTSESAAVTLADALNDTRSGSAHVIQANLATADYVDFIQKAAGFTGRLDALINNASVFFPTPLDSLSQDSWQKQVEINLKAPLFLSQAARHWLRKHHGCIVNITDIYAKRPLMDHTVYTVTRAGLSAMTRALARELAPDIRVNAIAPGAILWPENMENHHKQTILDSIPLLRLGDPLDIARSVLFLIEEANYLTGQVISIDGGRQLTR